MKALIVALVSLSLLAACSAREPIQFYTNPPPKTDPKTGDLKDIKAGMGVCRANKAVFVILINSEGQPEGFACEKVGNGNRGGGSSGPTIDITQPEKIPDLPNLTGVVIGQIYKYSDSDDPCYVWVIGGSRYHVCWDLPEDQ